MHTNEPRELQGVELGYDPRDINLRGITRAVIGFFIFTLVFFGGGAIWFIGRGHNTISKVDTRKPAIVGPKVQGDVTSKIEIMEMRQTETKLLTTYGTTPEGKQRIPISHAIDLLDSRGIPEVASEEPAKTVGTTIQQNAIAPATTNP